MRGLRARRHVAVGTRLRAGRAVTEAREVFAARQRRQRADAFQLRGKGRKALFVAVKRLFHALPSSVFNFIKIQFSFYIRFQRKNRTKIHRKLS